MTEESFEQLRKRLLRDEKVQRMIRARAYEIYEMRGRLPGNEARDWFLAETEVIAFLIANEPESAPGGVEASGNSQPVTAPSETEPMSQRPVKGSRARKATKEATAKKPRSKKAASKKTADPEAKQKRGSRKSKAESA